MDAEIPSEKEKFWSRSSWRRGLRRVLWCVLSLAIAAIVFHRPLLRWALSSGGPRLASAAGYDLSWTVEGSVTSGVTVRDLRLRGREDSALTRLDARELSATYSLWALLTRGTGDFLDTLAVSDVYVEADTRLLPDEPEEIEKESGFPVVWVDRLNLRNINAKVTAPGGETEVKGLSLVLAEERDGTVKIESLKLPEKREMQDIRGTTSVHDRTVRFADVTVDPSLKLNRLDIGLGELADAKLPVQLEATSGGATLTTTGTVSVLGSEVSLDAEVKLQNLTDVEIRKWVPLPEELVWQVEHSELELRGPVADPQALEGRISLDASNVRTRAIAADKAHVGASVSKGKLDLSSLILEAGDGSIRATGTAELPPRWDQMGRLSAQLQWSVDAPRLEKLMAGAQPVTGALQGSGTVEIAEGRLAGADGSLHGRSLRHGKWEMDSISAEASTDADSVKLKSLTAKLGDNNSVTLEGSIALAEPQPARFTWTLELGAPSKVAAMAGLQDASSIQAEKLSGRGSVAFSLTDLRAKDYTTLTAEGQVTIADFAWEDRRLELATLKFEERAMTAEIKEMDVKFDDVNQGNLKGRIQWDGRQDAEVEWRLELPDLEAVGPWLAWNPEWPKPTAGTLTTEGSAKGALADIRVGSYSEIQATVRAELDGFKSAKARAENATIDLSVNDGRADIRSSDVRFDSANQVAAHGHLLLEKPGAFALNLDARLPHLKELSGWSELFNGPAITGGSAMITWNGEGKVYEGDIRGSGAAEFKNVNVADRPPFSVTLNVQHNGRRAELTDLVASTGKFRFVAQATVSTFDISVPQMEVFSDEIRLARGAAKLPVVLDQKPRPAIPLDPSRPIDLTLHAEDLDLGKLYAAFGLKPPVRGTLDADIDLEGLLPELSGTINLQLESIKADAVEGKLAPAAVSLDATLAKRQLAVNAKVDQPPLRTLMVTGDAPVDVEKLMRDPASVLNTPVQAKVVLPESDLSIVRRFLPAISLVEGSVSANVDISGPARSPHWEGALVVNAPHAMIEKAQMDIKDLRARVSFDDKRITLDDVSVMLAGGQLRAAGGVDVTDLTNPTIDVRVEAGQALIMRDDSLSARTDGVVTITGTLKQAAVAGRAELVRCRVFKEIEFLPLSLPNQLPPPPPPVEKRESPALPGPFHAWTFDVDIVTRDSIRLLGNVFNGSATAELHVGGTGAAPDLVGEVSFQGARVRLPNSKLTVTRGTLIFTKDKPFEPELDVIGESRVGSYEVTVNAYGPAFAPKVRMSSSPPLAENEIATLLATGSIAGDEQSAASTAANQVAFTLLRKAYRSVFNKSAPKRYDDDFPRLTFGFSPLSTGTSQPGVSATYEISPRWEATGAVTERGTFRGMLHYLIRLR